MKKLNFQVPKENTTLILLMKLKSFKRFLIILLTIISILPVKAEEKIDIWKNDKKNQNKSIKIEETNELKREGNKIIKKIFQITISK